MKKSDAYKRITDDFIWRVEAAREYLKMGMRLSVESLDDPESEPLLLDKNVCDLIEDLLSEFIDSEE